MTSIDFDPNRTQRAGANQDPRLDWWREVRFGMFIHWGLYAIPAGVWKGKHIEGIGEWIMKRAEIPVAEYEALAKEFNPVKFDAAQIVSLAKKAGQRYLVITTKHHDGFCMFKTQHTDYNIVDGTPFGRDVLKELADECQKQDIALGLYYSQTQDWHHPDGDGNDWDYDEAQKDFDGYLNNLVKPHLRELLTNYGPIGLIWFDTPRRITKEQSASLLAYCNELQPDCLVCGRLGNALGDYASAPDNSIPASQYDTIDWETPATINDTWGFKEHDHNWKSTKTLIHNLVDIVSKGGNYLLNIGPDALGAVPQPSVDRLLEMGSWLEKNGESIYGTRGGPIQGLDWCRTTKKGDTIYLHILDWNEDGRFVLKDIQVASASWVDSSVTEPLEIKIEGGDTIIQGPKTMPDTLDTVIRLETK